MKEHAGPTSVSPSALAAFAIAGAALVVVTIVQQRWIASVVGVVWVVVVVLGGRRLRGAPARKQLLEHPLRTGVGLGLVVGLVIVLLSLDGDGSELRSAVGLAVVFLVLAPLFTLVARNDLRRRPADDAAAPKGVDPDR